MTSVPLSVCRLMQVNPCTRALAPALGGLVSLRWDRRAWLTLLAQELRWLSSDGLPTSTESGPMQTRQLLSTVTWQMGHVVCFKEFCTILGQSAGFQEPAACRVQSVTSNNLSKAFKSSVNVRAAALGGRLKDTITVHILHVRLPQIHFWNFQIN